MILLVIVGREVARFGVEIREPRATDAAASRQLQWRPQGLASGIKEFIDRNVPAAALSELGWRP